MIVSAQSTTDLQAVLTVIGRRPEELKLVDLSGAVVPGAELQNANLSRANLSRANLEIANLFSANRSAYLSSTNLFSANLGLAYLRDANLTRADLTDVGLNNREQLSRACGKPKVLPEGFTLDKPCPKHPN